MTVKTCEVVRETAVAAPASVVYGLVADVDRWTHLYPPAAHAEYLERGLDEDLVEQWSVVDEHTVRHWVVRRGLDPVRERTISFEHDPAGPLAVRGDWTFEPGIGDSTVVRMRHVFADTGNRDEIAARMAESSERYLTCLRDSAERREELEQIVISFEDPLFVSGSVKDVYEYLYEADKWPDRIPHVTRLVLEENTPGVQFFDMDTVSADGSRHTTRSVRICLPDDKIVYKQIRTPKMLEAHTGHWLFTETPEGVVASARHTATIRPAIVPEVLGAGAGVPEARRYLRRVLCANSVSNLRLAKEFAEQRAGV
ncbi:aromatase/cyclase [Amycolatopsis minnesotensis]|uniref:SRPBCC family protein n=1 Tax=Amycolatopsis minnesotensis TaxID=337894 RepID=A0ABP5BXZ1_9PSEU